MTLLAQSAIIMVLGMTVTSAFIGLVIAGVDVAARIIRRLEGSPAEPGPASSGFRTEDEGAVVAAIAATLLAGHDS